MRFSDLDHVYPCTPPGYEGTGLQLGLKVVPSAEFDQATMEYRGLTPDGITKKTNELIFSKIAFVKGYETESGRKIETGEDLYRYGLPDIWDWAKKAVFSARMLSVAEEKNSLRESVSDS